MPAKKSQPRNKDGRFRKKPGRTPNRRPAKKAKPAEKPKDRHARLTDTVKGLMSEICKLFTETSLDDTRRKVLATMICADLDTATVKEKADICGISERHYHRLRVDPDILKAIEEYSPLYVYRDFIEACNVLSKDLKTCPEPRDRHRAIRIYLSMSKPARMLAESAAPKTFINSSRSAEAVENMSDREVEEIYAGWLRNLGWKCTPPAAKKSHDQGRNNNSDAGASP